MRGEPGEKRFVVIYSLSMRLQTLLLLTVTACGGELVLPSHVDRDGTVTVVYRTNAQATGKGDLSFRWTDVYGRVIEDRKFPFELNDETEVGFSIDLRRAVAMKNELHAHFSFEGMNKKKERDHREEDAQAVFIARPPDRTWWDYTITMWQNYRREDFAKLKTIGINSGQFVGRNRTPPEFLIANDVRWYAENIATDYYSEYHRWKFDRPTNWQFTWVRELYKKDPSSLEPFKRHPSFSDEAWRKKIRDRLIESAKLYSPYRPLFYSLGDESGIADLSAFWDFDFSDYALTEMRPWLKMRYGTLAELNRAWGTNFEAWELVTPDTTNQAMKRADENWTAWADHKEFMDLSYANALKMGSNAVHSVDPDAYVGIGGAQMPGWGGYDYYRITQALNALEPYDIGNNIEIIRSLNPALAVITTSFAHGPWEKHRVWYEALHGGRGLILWDDRNEFITKEGAFGGRAEETAPYYRELRGGLGALLINSRRSADPIAIHYSQASMRTEWMLAQKPKGDAWAGRGSARERMDSTFLRLRESWCRLIEDLGLQYNFVAYGQIEKGELLKRGYRALVLPRSTALSRAEAQAIREFVEQGGLLIADGEPGTFDDRSRRLSRPLLADLFAGQGRFGRGRVATVEQDVLHYHQQRLVRKEETVHRWAQELFTAAGIRPEFAVTDASGKPVVGVETHVFRNGAVTIVGLHSNPQLRVDELGPPEFKSNERFEHPATVKLRLPAEMQVYDVRSGRAIGKKKELDVTVQPYEPSIFAIALDVMPELRIAAPSRIPRGETATIGVSAAGKTPAARHAFHIDVVDPLGKVLPQYSGNLIAPEGRAAKVLPIAENDPAGKWEIRVKDILSGKVSTAAIEVF